jgi:hypothetical protein
VKIGGEEEDKEEYYDSQCKVGCEARGEESISRRLEAYGVRHRNERRDGLYTARKGKIL